MPENCEANRWVGATFFRNTILETASAQGNTDNVRHANKKRCRGNRRNCGAPTPLNPGREIQSVTTERHPTQRGEQQENARNRQAPLNPKSGLKVQLSCSEPAQEKVWKKYRHRAIEVLGLDDPANAQLVLRDGASAASLAASSSRLGVLHDPWLGVRCHGSGSGDLLQALGRTSPVHH